MVTMRKKINRKLLRGILGGLTLVTIVAGYLIYNQLMANASVSGNKFLTANGANAATAGTASVNGANTYTATTTTAGDNSRFQIQESTDNIGGLGWNFTGWNALNTATETTGPKVTKVQLLMEASLVNSVSTTTAGDKTFTFRMYNFSNSTYDLNTTATRRLNSTTDAAFTLDFPSPQDYTNYFDASGNFRIQMMDTADGDAFNSMIRIDYMYVKIYYDNTVPNATWTSPSGNPSTYYTNAANVNLQANGDDNTSPDTETTGVSKMIFYYNNGTETPIGTDTVIDSGNATTGGVWSYSWANPTEGSYSVYARAYDGKNNQSSNTATQTIVVDRTAPTTTITAPTASGRINGNNYAITGTANDNNFNYYKVEYSPAGAGTWTQISTNQSIGVTNGTLINWNTTLVTDGNYDIRLTAYDKTTNTNSSTVSTVTVDNTAPTASLSYYSDAALTQPLPTSGGKAYSGTGTVYIKMTPNETLRSNAGDNQITIDAPGAANDVTNTNFTWTGSAWRYTWNVNGGNDGDTFSITVKATDLVGNVTTGPPSSGGIVTIDTTAPNLSLAYYYDANMTTQVSTSGGKPNVRTGTMYVKLVANESLSAAAGDHNLTIDAPGTVNDVSNQNFVWDAANNAWKYAWTVSGGNDGDTLSISVTGKDLVGNTYTGAPTAGAAVTVQTQPTPTNLTLSASPANVINDNSSTSNITAHLTDQYGSAIASAQINFSTTKGTLSAATALTNGSGDAAITIKSGVAGNATITGTLNGTGLSGTTTVTFAPPDYTTPTFDKAEATSKQLVYLTFSEPIKDPNIAGSTISINGGMTISQINLTSDARVVRLVLSSTQGTGNQSTPLTYTVTVNNIKDLANNNLASATQNFEAFTPHGKYAPSTFTSGNSTRMCGQCHFAHNGTGKEMLNNITITKTCFVCHGTTGISVYKVEDEFKSRVASGSTLSFTMHKSLDSDNPGYNVLYCTDCHNPHGNRTGSGNAVYPKLLRSKVGSSEYYQGNSFCYSCHGSTNQAFTGDVNYYDNTVGNHNNANAVHYDTAIQSGLMLPSSGTMITCMKCHERHGSKNSQLIDNSLSNTEEGLCYQCHGDTTNNNMESAQPTKLNIYRQFNIPSAPSTPTLATTSTGGSLMGNTTYYFKVTAYSSTTGWESLPSLESSISVPAGTNTNKITVTIPQYTGASNGFDQFKIYMSYRGIAPNPTLASVAMQNFGSGSLQYLFASGTYYVKVSANGPFGETFPSNEVSVAVAANQNLQITLPNYPNVAGYPSAVYYKLFISTTSGNEKLEATTPNNTVKTIKTQLKGNGEAVPSFSGNNDMETYQASVNANLSGNTTYNQTAAPLTNYPVPKGSSHQINPTDPSRSGSKIECTSCHGPHTSDNVKYSANQATSAMSDPMNTKKYWVQSGVSDSTISVGTMADWCLRCHSGTGNLVQINTSTAKIPVTLGWPNIDFTNNSSGWFKDTVWPNSKHKNAGLVCTSCHDPHGSKEHLILKYPYDGFDYKGNCLRCHDGSTPPAKNISAEFQKASRHPALDPGFGGHEIDENYNGLGDSPTLNRHAECEDCHDPHSADNTTATAPNPVGSIKNVTGVGFASNAVADRPVWTSLAKSNTNYVFKRPLQFEFELCYKCHSSYAFGTYVHTSTSGAYETDVAMQFNPNNTSYHPVEAVGKNPMTGQTNNFTAGSGFTATSQMYCFDCHGDNKYLADGVTLNPNPIRGPHGSINKYLLKQPYDSGEQNNLIAVNKLCDMCHNPTVYNSNSNATTYANYTGFKNTSNLHLQHRNSYYPSYFIDSQRYFCGDCHGLYVHGQKRPNLIAYSTDPYPFGAWSALTKWKDPGTYGGSYGESSCTVSVKPGSNTACYGGHSGTSPFNP